MKGLGFRQHDAQFCQFLFWRHGSSLPALVFLYDRSRRMIATTVVSSPFRGAVPSPRPPGLRRTADEWWGRHFPLRNSRANCQGDGGRSRFHPELAHDRGNVTGGSALADEERVRDVLV